MAGGLGYWRYWPEDGLWNPCLPGPLPRALVNHNLVRDAFKGIDAARLWDVHVHLVGTGDFVRNGEVWVNPKMSSWAHPLLKTQLSFYLNGSCVREAETVDRSYITRLSGLMNDFPLGARCMLMAFDHRYNGKGEIDMENTPFHIANRYAAQTAHARPERFEWIASVNPHRDDAVAELDKAVVSGARAVKWLPQAMGIDPASPRCDAFYAALVKHNIPLLSHAGREQAVESKEDADFGNPLKLRRPLEKGVRVIVAHCASLGEYPDTDAGKKGSTATGFELFSRMMSEQQHQSRLMGDISGVLLINRVGTPLERIVRNTHWHSRLLNGSDYPLPGVLPVTAVKDMVSRRYLTAAQAELLILLRRYNPLLFDFVLKRSLRVDGQKLSVGIFHTRDRFQMQAGSPAQTPAKT